MAIVTLDTNLWPNADGLPVRFGLDNARPSRSGEYSRMTDGTHLVSTIVDLTKLPTVASANKMILDNYVTLPTGAFITKVTVTVLKAPTSGGSPAFNLGLIALDRTTVTATTGLLAAATAWAAGTIGSITEYTQATSQVGSVVGTKITTQALLLAYATTADWTAGVVKIDIVFYMPLAADL